MRSPAAVQTTVIGGGAGGNAPNSPPSSKIALLRMQHQQILASIYGPNNNIQNKDKAASPIRTRGGNHNSNNHNNNLGALSPPPPISDSNSASLLLLSANQKNRATRIMTPPPANHFEAPSQSPSRRHVNNFSTSASSSSLYHYQSPQEIELLMEIKRLEENIVKEKLRSEWAHRRIIAMESVHNANAEDPKATLFRMEKRLENAKKTPQQKRSFLMNDGYDDYGHKIAENISSSKENSYASIERNRRNFSPSSTHAFAQGQSSETSPRGERAAANWVVVPSNRELHTDVAGRVDRLEAQGRRIHDGIAEVALLRETAERTHRDKVNALRCLRDRCRDAKLAAESQLRVAEGAVSDDDELSEKQYRRYAARLETARQDSLRRHEANLKKQEERSDLRCNLIQRETKELVESMAKLIAEKEKQFQEASGREKSSFATATSLGSRVEEIEQAGVDIVKLTKKLDLLRIQQREIDKEIPQIVEGIRTSHFDLLERDGKLEASGPATEQQLRTQQAKNEALLLSVRTLQERIAVLAKRRRFDANSSSHSNNNNSNYSTLASSFSSPGDERDHQQQQQQQHRRQHRQDERSIFFLDKKFEELNQVTYSTKLEVHAKEQELAKLSNNYNHLHERLTEVGLESEMLEARIGKLRHASAVSRAEQELRLTGNSVALTGVGAAGSLFMSKR